MHGFAEITTGIFKMPATMLQLAIVQFFTWLAFFAMWIYTTSGIAQNAFGTTDTTSKTFQDAGDWVGVMFMVYNGVSAITAFLLPMLAKRIGRKYTHMICLIIGGLGLLSIYFITNPTMIVVSMGMVGIAWASILSMPYAMLSNALPAHKMGYYMGVFNFFIVIPQIVAASILGFFTMKVFQANTLNTVALGGVAMIIAGLLTLLVKDEDK